MRAAKIGNTYKATQSTSSTIWLPNYEIVGSPTISADYIVSNPTTSNYVKPYGGYAIANQNNWELVFKIKGYRTSGDSNPICSEDRDSGYVSKVLIGISGKIGLYLSNGHSSWDLCGFQTSDSIPADEWVYIKVEFTGTAYIISTSSDGETWTEKGRNTTSTAYANTLNRIGMSKQSPNNGFGGEIDLKGCWCKKNGTKTWWGVAEVNQQAYKGVNL